LDAASCSEMPVRVPVNIVTKGHLLARWASPQPLLFLLVGGLVSVSCRF
jgi:hypothetical protein